LSRSTTRARRALGVHDREQRLHFVAELALGLRAHLHAYGKDGAPGRKVGHVTIRAESKRELCDKVEALLPIVDPEGAPRPCR
jgi:phosphoribosylaminoimidazole carboxylase (NCAIR synthetase)